jgi:hypothetical protein
MLEPHFHFLRRDTPLLCRQIDFGPYSMPNLARTAKIERGNLQGAL